MTGIALLLLVVGPVASALFTEFAIGMGVARAVGALRLKARNS